jgi:hypothetical protein
MDDITSKLIDFELARRVRRKGDQAHAAPSTPLRVIFSSTRERRSTQVVVSGALAREAALNDCARRAFEDLRRLALGTAARYSVAA